MSCHCLWGNFLYGHFCLLRFSTLIRLGRSKIREILTEYIAPPASRGRHKIIQAHDLKCIFSDIPHPDHVAFLHVRVHCETQELDVELICEGSRQDARRNESGMNISRTVWVCLKRFLKRCRNKTQGGCVKVNNHSEIYRYGFFTFVRAIYKIS